MITYLVAYFICNFILVFRMIRNVFFIPHPPEDEKEMREDFPLFLPAMLLFGTIFIVMEYIYRSIDGE